MSEHVFVIYRNGAIEDHYSAVVQVALSEEGAQKWIDETVALYKKKAAAQKVGRAALEAWQAENPNPFTEEPPPQPKKWPNGVGKKDPRYPELRARRDAEKKALREWGERKLAADVAYDDRCQAVFTEAIKDFGFTDEEARDVRRAFLWNLAEIDDEYYFEKWKPVDA